MLIRDAFLFFVTIQVLLIFPKTHVNIDIHHHFLRDNVEKGLVSVNFCASNEQIADIFTKALNREQIEKNRLELGLIKTT